MNFENIKKETLLIVFDTNAILDIYKYPKDTLKQLVETFEKNKDLFWIPQQVYEEYTKNKYQGQKSNLFLCKNLKKTISNGLNKTNRSLQGMVLQVLEYKSFDFYNIKNEFELDINGIVEKYNKKIDLLKLTLEKDEILEEDILSEFIQKIKSNKEFTQLELIDIYEEGEKRYKYNIAPGYKDKNKDVRERYGDLVIWKEILKKIKNKNYNLVFIQNEKKDDWWKDYDKKIIQKVLIEEFQSNAKKDANFYMMNFEYFLNNFYKLLSINHSSVKSINAIYETKKYIEKHINSIIMKSDVFEYIDNRIDDFLRKYVNSCYTSGYFGRHEIKRIDEQDTEITLKKNNKSSYVYLANMSYRINVTGGGFIQSGRGEEEYYFKGTFLLKSDFNIISDFENDSNDFEVNINDINIFDDGNIDETFVQIHTF